MTQETTLVAIEGISIKSTFDGHEATTQVDDATVTLKLDHQYKPLSIHVSGSATKVLYEGTVGCACEKFSELLVAADAYTTENIIILQNLCNH